MSPTKPFKLSGLPSFTRQQVALQQSVLTYLSARPAEPSFSKDLAKVLGRELRCDVAIDSPTVHTVSRDELGKLMPEVGLFAVVGFGPSTHKLIADFDPHFGAWCIDRLLGGTEAKAGRGEVARAPTDMEAGVFSYLLLHAMAFMGSQGSGLRSGSQLGLMLDRVLGTSSAVEEYLADEDYITLGARIEAGSVLGSVRLLLPASLVNQHFGAPVSSQKPTGFELSLMRKRLGALPEQFVYGRVIGAHLDLSQEDLAGLETGDIIILENHSLRAKADVGLSGSVKIIVGSGRHGHIAARLYDEAGSARLEITHIVEQNEPTGGAVSEEQPHDSDNLPETMGLLREMDSHVAVELGRLRLNTAQLVRLKTGQVLPLNRGATDPVELVVGGKLFGRGELLEVDGELGVRITQLTGDT